MDASRFQFATLFVVQIKICLHTSKRARHVIDDLID